MLQAKSLLAKQKQVMKARDEEVGKLKAQVEGASKHEAEQGQVRRSIS